LYALWGGGNDILFQLEAAATGAVTPAQAQANVAASAVALVQQVGVLQASGARNNVVMNLPDIGRSPGGTASGQSAQLSAISNLFNSTLIGGLDALGGSTIRVNTFGLFNEMLANPAAFGFANVTTPRAARRRRSFAPARTSSPRMQRAHSFSPTTCTPPPRVTR